MDNVMLEVQDLSLNRGGNQVLDNINLTIKEHETLVIIGQSGSGKSSFLRCLNRLELFQQGKIFFKGTDISTLPVLQLRRQVGMVFQKAAVFEGTVADNIAYGPKLRKEQIPRERILNLMQQVALETELIDRNAHELSGGQEQRLAIARALANRPDILLLDEPTSALDPIATRKIEETLSNLCLETGLTLVWVSHSVEQARRVADRVLLLEKGHIVKLDTVTAMLDVDKGDPRVLAFAKGIEEEEYNVS